MPFQNIRVLQIVYHVKCKQVKPPTATGSIEREFYTLFCLYESVHLFSRHRCEHFSLAVHIPKLLNCM